MTVITQVRVGHALGKMFNRNSVCNIISNKEERKAMALKRCINFPALTLNIRKRQQPVPAEDYNVLSGDTRNNQESHKELQRPVGTWSQNEQAAGTFGQVQIQTQDASDETCHNHGISPLQTNNTLRYPNGVLTFKKGNDSVSNEFSSENLTGIDTSQCLAIRPNSAGVACIIKNSQLAQEASYH